MKLKTWYHFGQTYSNTTLVKVKFMTYSSITARCTNSNTTLVKVKCFVFDGAKGLITNSNTTLVKVKLQHYTN